MVHVYLPPNAAGAAGYASRSTLAIQQALGQLNEESAAASGTRGNCAVPAATRSGAKKGTLFDRFMTKLGITRSPGAADVESSQKRSTIQIFNYFSAQSARKSMQSILSAKVNVCDARAVDLQSILARSRLELTHRRQMFSMQHPGAMAAAQVPPVRVLLLNFLPEQVQILEHQLQGACHMRAVSLDDAKDWSTLVSTARKDFLVPPPGMPMTPQAADQEGMEPQVVVIRFAAPHVSPLCTRFEELPSQMQCLLGIHFMASRYIISFVDFPTENNMVEALRSILPQAFPICSHLKNVVECCTNPEAIPLFVTVRKQILADVSQRIQGIMTTNYALYAAVRVPGAVVPFGIQLTNFLDTIRLTHKILRVVGMTEDHESIASAAAAGRIMWVKNAAVGVLTDLYTFTAGGAVSLSLASTVLMGDSFAAALSAFAATDLVFVGAISVISGAVSAITGAISRPHLATSITELISTLQTLWLLCTDVRRRPVDEASVKVANTKRLDPELDAPDLFVHNNPEALLSPEQLAQIIGESDCPIVTISYDDIQSGTTPPEEHSGSDWTQNSISTVTSDVSTILTGRLQQHSSAVCGTARPLPLLGTPLNDRIIAPNALQQRPGMSPLPLIPEGTPRLPEFPEPHGELGMVHAPSQEAGLQGVRPYALGRPQFSESHGEPLGTSQVRDQEAGLQGMGPDAHAAGMQGMGHDAHAAGMQGMGPSALAMPAQGVAFVRDDAEATYARPDENAHKSEATGLDLSSSEDEEGEDVNVLAVKFQEHLRQKVKPAAEPQGRPLGSYAERVPPAARHQDGWCEEGSGPQAAEFGREQGFAGDRNARVAEQGGWQAGVPRHPALQAERVPSAASHQDSWREEVNAAPQAAAFGRKQDYAGEPIARQAEQGHARDPNSRLADHGYAEDLHARLAGQGHARDPSAHPAEQGGAPRPGVWCADHANSTAATHASEARASSLASLGVSEVAHGGTSVAAAGRLMSGASSMSDSAYSCQQDSGWASQAPPRKPPDPLVSPGASHIQPATASAMSHSERPWGSPAPGRAGPYESFHSCIDTSKGALREHQGGAPLHDVLQGSFSGAPDARKGSFSGAGVEQTRQDVAFDAHTRPYTSPEQPNAPQRPMHGAYGTGPDEHAGQQVMSNPDAAFHAHPVPSGLRDHDAVLQGAPPDQGAFADERAGVETMHDDVLFDDHVVHIAPAPARPSDQRALHEQGTSQYDERPTSESALAIGAAESSGPAKVWDWNSLELHVAGHVPASSGVAGTVEHPEVISGGTGINQAQQAVQNKRMAVLEELNAQRAGGAYAPPALDNCGTQTAPEQLSSGGDADAAAASMVAGAVKNQAGVAGQGEDGGVSDTFSSSLSIAQILERLQEEEASVKSSASYYLSKLVQEQSATLSRSLRH